jgi:hypothetical protein
MNGTYEVVMAVILLFPWSLVMTMVAGTIWHRAQLFVRPRSGRGASRA